MGEVIPCGAPKSAQGTTHGAGDQTEVNPKQGELGSGWGTFLYIKSSNGLRIFYLKIL